MFLRPPFIISSRLLPALPLADGFLHLDGFTDAEEGRQKARFILDRPGEEEYVIDTLKSGCGGFREVAEAFDALLAFMEADIESSRHEMYTGKPPQEPPLFPDHIRNWLYDKADEIALARFELLDDSGSLRPQLIERG